MSGLSPAAQAVLDITYNTFDLQDSFSLRKTVAAALRAAADHLGEELEFYNARMIDAEDLLAIANELEGQ